MKTLIFIKSDRSGCLRVLPHIATALGVAPIHYFDAFGAKSGEEMIEQIITGKLRDRDGVWYVEEGAFPEEGSYFFDRVSAEVDCVLIIRFSIDSRIHIEVAKARLTALALGDSFVIPRETVIGGLFKPYNLSGVTDVDE